MDKERIAPPAGNPKKSSTTTNTAAYLPRPAPSAPLMPQVVKNGGEGGTSKTTSWSPASDGIVQNSPTLGKEINNVLYGRGNLRRRLPIFEEICPSERADLDK